jgi:hypothetical protein
MENQIDMSIPYEEVFSHMPLDHLIGVSLLIASLVGMVLLFAYRVIKEISKRNKY